MANLARQELFFGRFYTLDELSESIEAVTAEEVGEVARDCFDTRHIAVTVLGRLAGSRLRARNWSANSGDRLRNLGINSEVT